MNWQPEKQKAGAESNLNLSFIARIFSVVIKTLVKIMKRDLSSTGFDSNLSITLQHSHFTPFPGDRHE
jgi:hypothetical protein